MIPSHKWFPRDLASQVVWFQNFTTKFAEVAATLGLEEHVADLQKDNAVMQELGNARADAESYESAVSHYIKIITQNNVGTPQPVFPASPTAKVTNPVATGIFERLVKLVDLIRLADNYTDEIGALLGILPTKEDEISPGEMKPDIKAGALPTSQAEVLFVRGDSDGVRVYYQIGDSNDWSNGENFGKSPAILTIPATAPVLVKIRARYLDGNNPVGDYSDIVTIVTEP